MPRPRAVFAGGGRRWVRTNVCLTGGFTGSRRGESQNALTWRNTIAQPGGLSAQPLLNRTACQRFRSADPAARLPRPGPGFTDGFPL